MNGNVSFIGTGNMGGALIKAACQAIPAGQIYITDHSLDKAQEMAQALGCHAVEGNAAAAEQGEYVFLCVKPQILPDVLREIAPILNRRLAGGSRLCLVSIAAGVQIGSIRARLEGDSARMPIVRIMPNITASVGKGMLALATDKVADQAHIDDVKEILSRAGRIDDLGEHLMDQFTAISGCLPAFVFMFLEAVADGGVMTGLTRAQSLEYAAQTIIGSATMFLESGTHPGALKDAVCSPAGSTLAGVAALERNNFRYAAMQAIVESYEKNKALGK